MSKVKQPVFLPQNRRKKDEGFTEMSLTQKKEYRKERQRVYDSKKEREVQRLKDNGYLTKSNYQLVTGSSSD